MTYIKKEPIIEFITKGLNNPDNSKAYGHDAIEILAEIEYTPTTDVKEVVRCKDCKHATFYSCKNDSCYKGIICEYQIGIGDENFFCACGEKK